MYWRKKVTVWCEVFSFQISESSFTYSWSKTPLDDALFFGHDRIASYLVQRGGRTGTDVLQSDNQGLN